MGCPIGAHKRHVQPMRECGRRRVVERAPEHPAHIQGLVSKPGIEPDDDDLVPGQTLPEARRRVYTVEPSCDIKDFVYKDDRDDKPHVSLRMPVEQRAGLG